MLRRISPLVIVIAALGCGRSAQEEYESALNIYFLEGQRLEQLENKTAPQDPGSQHYHAKDVSKQMERVAQAKLRLEKAETVFYGD